MSTLVNTESGRVAAPVCEEINTWRRIKKKLSVNSTDSDLKLYILARAYRNNSVPLLVSANGRKPIELYPEKRGVYQWYAVTICPSYIVSGINTFEIWAESSAMNAWSVALEPGHKEPDSYLSTDGGNTWNNHSMGYLNNLRGEYVIRARQEKGKDPPPPAMTWENYHNPRVRGLREKFQNMFLNYPDTFSLARDLASWISIQWQYRNTKAATIYGPWDIDTILAWGRTHEGHIGKLPILMCVHYAVAFVTAITSLGIPARAVALTGTINGMNGHFVSEVWIKELHKWVMFDPNLDAIVENDGVPFSVDEIRENKNYIREMVKFGPGYEYHKKNKLVQGFVDLFLDGTCYEHRSVWPYTDFLTHPQRSPTAHGFVRYCETDWIWEEGDEVDGFGMFRYFGSKAFFNKPPTDFPHPEKL